MSITAEEIAKLNTAVVENRRRFGILFCSAVLVLSFVYGLSAGLTRERGRAFASKLNLVPIASYRPSSSIPLPRGVSAIPVGNDVTINGLAGEMVNFISHRGVRGVLGDSVKQFERMGYRVVGITDSKRGVFIGYDLASGKRVSASAYLVPPQIRQKVSLGRQTHGFIFIVDPHSRPDEAASEIPGIPSPAGTIKSGVFSSDDLGGRSYTGFYSVQGDTFAAISYYRNALAADGWEEKPLPGGSAESALRFVKSGQEAMFLFSPVSDNRGTGAGRTLAFIILRPFLVDVTV